MKREEWDVQPTDTSSPEPSDSLQPWKRVPREFGLSNGVGFNQQSCCNVNARVQGCCPREKKYPLLSQSDYFDLHTNKPSRKTCDDTNSMMGNSENTHKQLVIVLLAVATPVVV